MPPLRRTLFTVVVAAIGLVAGAGGSAAASDPEPTGPATTATDLVSFGIAPASPERPDNRSFLQYTVGPGTVIYDNVALLNQDDAPVDLSVYPSEVTTGADGGLAVPGKDAALADSGTWIATGTTDVTVPAQTKQTGLGYVVVPFTVTVPANAEPGDHVGAIVASLVARGQGGEGSPAINLEQRVAARLYITVDGDLAPGLVVTNLGAGYRPGGLVAAGRVDASYNLSNTGNTRLKVTPSVRVSGPFGWSSRSAAGEVVDELLPGSTVHQDVTVEGVWPFIRLSVQVVAEAGAPAVAGIDPGIPPATASTQLWVIPWLWLGALVLVVGTLVTWRLVRRWRRRRRAGRRRHQPAGPEPAAEAATPGARDGASAFDESSSVVLRSPEVGRSFTRARQRRT